MRLKLRVGAAATVAGLATLAFAGMASADTLGPITFEPATYTTGTINGQDGWSSLGADGSGCAVYDHTVAPTGDFPGAPASFGSQSLRMSNAVTSGCFGDQTFSKSLANEAGETSAVSDGLSGGTRQRHFEAQWSFWSTVPNAEQPGLYVVASPDRGDGARMSWVEMADSPAGLEVNFYDYQDGAVEAAGTCVTGDNFIFSNVASGLDRNLPHTIRITMDFVDGSGNDVVRVYVDGVLGHTGTSWEDYFRYCEPNPTRPVDSILFRTGGGGAPGTLGNGFLIDNLSLESAPSDTTDPVVTVTAPATVNATSPAGATVNYTVSVTDDDPNVGAASCLPTSGSTFPVGATTITCTATDTSGNTGTGTATVTVVVTSNFLCTLTKQYIQGSAKYQGSSAFRKGAVNLLTRAACKLLTSIGPHFSPPHKAAFISAYKHYVSGLVPGGWLTSSQATTLRNLADAL